MRAMIVAGVLGCAGAALAQVGQQPETPVLAGPRVAEATSAATLVERDFSGRLKRLDLPAAEAAISLLTLDEATKAKVDALLAERMAILDGLVIENLDLLVELNNARQAGQKAESMRLLYDGLQKFAPLREWGKVEEKVGAVLSASEAQRYRSLVREYRDALKRELAEEARTRGEKPRPMGLEVQAGLIDLGLDIKRSYERQVASKSQDFEKVLGRLGLEPEQEAAIRNRVTRFFEETKGRPTEAQKRDLFLSILTGLTREQQRTLLRYTVGGETP